MTRDQLIALINTNITPSDPADKITSEELRGVLFELNDGVDAKVDKITGKQLSTEDYTTTEKTKLGGIEAGAQKNVDATTTVKGNVMLAGDLAGTAVAPTVPGLANKVDKAESKETVITTSGTFNDLATPTNFVRFTNQAGAVIISGLANPVDGKRAVIINNTLSNISILHEAVSSVAANRLLNNNAQNLYIAAGGSALFIYSLSLARWVLINIWATDYFATLVGTTRRAMEVTAEGYATASELTEMKTWRDAQTVAMTKADLNINYPTYTRGMQVICHNIAGGGKIYEKVDDSANNWISHDVLIVS